MIVNHIYRRITVLLLSLTAICLNGCTSGWYGTTAHIQEPQNFVNKAKHEIIEQLGVPDGSFPRGNGIECWLYRSHCFSYFLLIGKKKEKGLVIKFENNIVSDIHSVDQGALDEIATRGWEYLDLLPKD